MAHTRIEVAPHLSAEELEQRYKAATNARDARRWHVLWLMREGRTTSEVARICGTHRYTVREIVKRFNERGAGGPLDRRHQSAGKPPRLTPEQQGRLLDSGGMPALRVSQVYLPIGASSLFNVNTAWRFQVQQ